MQPTKHTLTAQISRTELNQLDDLAEHFGVSRSTMVRNLIHEKHRELAKIIQQKKDSSL